MLIYYYVIIIGFMLLLLLLLYYYITQLFNIYLLRSDGKRSFDKTIVRLHLHII